MKPTFNIAVRSLVEHVLRKGDLRSDFWGAVQAVEGIRSQQRVQRRRPAGYETEVPVHGQVEDPELILSIGGRLDGLLPSASPVMIEEIKTTRRSFEELEVHPDAVHWGQITCYGYLLAQQKSLPMVQLHLTYIQPDPWRTQTQVRQMTFEELSDFFNGVVSQYMNWMRQVVRWNDLRDQSLSHLDFPFAKFRPGQRQLAVAAYRTIRDGGHLIAQAPTGIGKTMAVLFPALKALSDQLVPKIVFLTARTTGRLVAEAALDMLRKSGLRLKTVSLTAKDKICFLPERWCVPEHCPYAKGYYDRLMPAMIDAFQNDTFTRGSIEAVARQHQVCPFELSLELVQWADGIIADYNYAFDPQVVLRRFFIEEGHQQAVLVDEAHNLVDRSREMFSAQLTKSSMLAVRRLIKDDLPGLARRLTRINTWMATARRRCSQDGLQGVCIVHDAPQELVDLIRKFVSIAEKWLSKNVQAPFRDELVGLFFDCLGFIRTAERYDACYATIMKTEGKSFSIHLFCVDPSRQLDLVWQRCRAAVLFSATLSPPGYFQSILGCSEQTQHLRLPSPFPKDNLLVAVHGISTIFHQRQASCQAITKILSQLVSLHAGHYMFFFPSYDYMEMVHKQFVQQSHSISIISQSKNMDEEQREAFLNRFKSELPGTLVGFAVMGGVFGEGVDLKGDHLTAAVIVGVGLPAICHERELIRAYFDKHNGQGFAFAYQYPGINRVLQAAGRVIRCETDRGLVLLIDHRYSNRNYRVLLPPHWETQSMRNASHLSQMVGNFWDGHE